VRKELGWDATPLFIGYNVVAMEGLLLLGLLGVVLIGLIFWRRWVLLRPTLWRVVEPLGFLFRDFSLARVVGDEDKTLSLLMSFCRASSGTPSILDEILEEVVTLPRRPARPVSLLLEKPLSIIGRQRVFHRNKQIVSVAVGEIDELKDMISSLPEGWRHEARRAAGRGFLPLLVVVAEPVGEMYQTFKIAHQPAGLILIEGNIDSQRAKTLKGWGEEAVRFLTFAPKELAEWLYVRLFPEADPLILTPNQLRDVRPLKKKDEMVKTATIYAAAGLEDRYRALGAWGNHQPVEFYSRNAEDDDLPIEPHATLP